MENPRFSWKHYLTITATIIGGSILLLSGCASNRVTISPDDHSSAHETALLQQAEQYFGTQNYSQALPLLRHLSKRKNSDAQYALAYMYYYGIGVSRDESTALNWMRLSAAKNNPRAILALEIYRETSGLPKIP